MPNISDVVAKAMDCPGNYSSFRDQALLGLRFSPKPLCAVWETHSSDFLMEMALGVPFLAGWGFLGDPGMALTALMVFAEFKPSKHS